MDEETNTVETSVKVAVPAQEVDYEALLAEKDAELIKVQSEKENYRKGLLKAKGKIPDDYQSDTDNIEDADSRTRRIVEETLLSTRESQLHSEKDAVLKAALKRIKEVELALKNRGSVTSGTGEGSNQDKPEGKKDNYFSNDQLTYFKSKGWSDEKIEAAKRNMAKVNQMPKV